MQQRNSDDATGFQVKAGEGSNVYQAGQDINQFNETGEVYQSNIRQEVEGNGNQVLGQMLGGQVYKEVKTETLFSGCNITYQAPAGMSLPMATSLVERDIPPLLPYLPNRTEQEFELVPAIKRFMAESVRRPLVCIVHGDEWQSHDMFLERLCRVSLPRLLKLDRSKVTVKEYPLSWPSGLKIIERLPERLRTDLADTVEDYSLATTEQINQTFSHYPGPILVHLHISTSEWQRLGLGLLRKVLQFWQDWPDLKPDQVLVVCICIKYQVNRPSSKRPRWWFLQWVGWLSRTLRNRRCSRLNLKVKQQIEQLEQSGFQSLNHLIGVVLPKLEDVTQSNVEDWARSKVIKTFVGEAQLGELREAVQRMFGEQGIAPETTIAMDEVARQLKALLQSLTTNRGQQR